MTGFKVVWEVDQDAETPAEAALLVAREYFKERIARGVVGSACVFQVVEPNVPPYLIDLSLADQGLTATELRELYGFQGHPRYHYTFWRQEVADQSTVLGYWEWVQHKVEEAGHER